MLEQKLGPFCVFLEYYHLGLLAQFLHLFQVRMTIILN